MITKPINDYQIN